MEENIAYNAFLVGKSLLGMRVTDILAAVQKVKSATNAQAIIVCGRRDAALTAALAAAVDPSIDRIAIEEILPSFSSLFAAHGRAINAASILPDLLRRFGDIAEVLREIGSRKVLIAGSPELPDHGHSVTLAAGRFTQDAKLLTDWLKQ